MLPKESSMVLSREMGTKDKAQTTKNQMLASAAC